MASPAVEESRRRSMLPLVTGKKSIVQVAAQQDRDGQASIPAVLTPSDLGRSRSSRRNVPENHIAKPGINGKGSTKIDVKAPRASGILAPRSDNYRTPSTSVSQQPSQLLNRPANTSAVRYRQSDAEIPLKKSGTTKPIAHERTSSITKQARAESTLHQHGPTTNKQLPVSHMPSTNLLPPRKDQRPAFSTLQQHFSPKKSGKAPTSSFFVSPSNKQVLNDKSFTETAFLQMELTQLHLLHRSSTATHAQWEKSAEWSLQRQFETLSRQHVELKEIACESQALINQSALLLWCRQVSDVDVAEKVKLLSRCILDIDSMLNSESQLPLVLRQFEVWSSRASRIQNPRRYSDHAVGLSLEFVETIGDGWIAEVESLNKKLSCLSRDLDSLGDAHEESSVSRVLVMLKSIVSSVFVELKLIRSIEYEVMIQEASWVQDMIESLADDVDHDVATSYKGAWHNEE